MAGRPDEVCIDGFMTQLAPAPPGTIGRGDVVMHATDAVAASGAWRLVADDTAAGGARLQHPDAGAAKLNTPLANPANYFEVKAHVAIERPYSLWIRGKAQGDHFNNDSVYVQFSTAVSGDNPDQEPFPNYVYRIGTTNALAVVFEDCRGCGLKGWSWADAGYGFKVSGPPLTFDSEEQTIRIQSREDGVSIDQIVLAPYSRSAYAAQAPGFQKEDDTILPSHPDGRAGDDDIVIYPGVPGGGDFHGAWTRTEDSSAAGGFRLRHPDAGAGKLAGPLAAPTNYFDVAFDVPANGVPYRLWIRGRADRDFWGNDSVFVQFSDVLNDDGGPVWKIGTTSAATYVLEDCNGCGVQGWGWNDNGYGSGVLGPTVVFATAGTQRIRIQTREDGLSIDQIVLSPGRYLNSAPGATKNDTTIVAR
jgi:hypothetical protein